MTAERFPSHRVRLLGLYNWLEQILPSSGNQNSLPQRQADRAIKPDQNQKMIDFETQQVKTFEARSLQELEPHLSTINLIGQYQFVTYWSVTKVGSRC